MQRPGNKAYKLINKFYVLFMMPSLEPFLLISGSSSIIRWKEKDFREKCLRLTKGFGI
jgi:hypothetical protein